ncbi:MAG: magnesium transporter [Actinomycetota bacterium]|nr:magnesium transporter [Actinomycetota bacterium]
MPSTTNATWVDLLDPTEAELMQALPAGVHAVAIETYLRRHDDDPRPRLVADGEYLFGTFVIPKVNELTDDEDTVTYQEVDLYIALDRLVTIRKTPSEGGDPFPLELVEGAVHAARDQRPGTWTYLLFDAFAEGYLDLVDALHAEIDRLEDNVEVWDNDKVRSRISGLRHELLKVRRTLSPFRDLVRAIVDDRIELEGGEELFTKELEVHFGDAYDKMLRASEGVDFARDLLSGVRDYAQAKVANDQNDVMKRLTVVASLLLVPTFVVGVYGQNFDHIPELHWHYGYFMSWGLIALITAGQLWYFKRKRWT